MSVSHPGGDVEFTKFGVQWGEFIVGKEHLGVVSEQMVLKIVRLEIITKGMNVNRKEK